MIRSFVLVLGSACWESCSRSRTLAATLSLIGHHSRSLCPLRSGREWNPRFIPLNTILPRQIFPLICQTI